MIGWVSRAQDTLETEVCLTGLRPLLAGCHYLSVPSKILISKIGVFSVLAKLWLRFGQV